MKTGEVKRCEACRRPQWRGPRMEQVLLSGVGETLLCIDSAECRRNWPADLRR